METKKRKMVDDGMAMDLVDVDGVAGGEYPEAGLQEPEVPSRKQEHLYMLHEKQFRSIFPEETWLSILNKLDREDKENCANASPYFWELLQKQRTLFLCPKVIDIMALIFEQNYDVRKITTAEQDGDDAMSGEPVAMAGTMNLSFKAEEWKQTVLKCRLVCSAWNTAVEKCYQKPEMTGIPEFVDELNPKSKLNNLRADNWTKSLVCALFDEHPRGIRQFLEHFDESHHSGIGAPQKNPFLGRFLVISIRSSSTGDVIEVLKKFGTEIWYLEVGIYGAQPSTTQAYLNLQVFRKLRSYLRLVPNLKFLKIRSDYPIAHVSSQSGKHRDIIVCSPLPTFKKLEILSLKNLGPQIGSELIRKNAHVAYLKITLMNLDEDVENSLEMPNLQGFSVLDSPSGEKMLENYAPIWKKVKKLCFGVGYERNRYPNRRCVRPTVGLGAPEAFAIFQTNWAETLTDLRLHHAFGLDKNTVMEQSKALRLNLPGVRRLTLCEFPCVFLDFALPLKNCLEHLVLQFDREFAVEISDKYKQRVERKQNIQLAGFEDRMLMSNIWEIFGKLETIKIENLWNFGQNFTLFTKEKEKFDYS